MKVRKSERFWLTAIFSTLLCLSQSASGASPKNAFLIVFKDKPFEADRIPLSEKALSRRVKFHITLDSTDYFVNPDYIQSVCADSSIGFRYSLKWMNGIVVHSGKTDLKYLLSKHPFILSISYVGLTGVKEREQPRPAAILPMSEDGNQLDETDFPDTYPNQEQNSQIGVDGLHTLGNYGKGVWVAVFDAGFYNINKIKAFEHNRLEGRLWSGYDIVDLDNLLLDTDNHGTAVASCIAGYEKGKYMGSAPHAGLMLFRTENSGSEYPLEELNWMKAAEIADSAGVDLVSSSVGYTQYDDPELSYKHSDLDGLTSFISKAARLLMKKGVLVVNSAGNSGLGSWVKIGTPADVAEILTVGAVDSKGIIGNFSSKGYNARGVVKPDVCALGVKALVASTYNSYYKGNGTSYSTPIVAGAMACLMQAFPNIKPEEIADAARNTATRNSIPDTSYGYGVLNTYATYLYLTYAANGFNIAPGLQDGNHPYLLFNNDFTHIKYSLYEETTFLRLFTLKKKIKTEEIVSREKFSYLNLESDSINCTVKYTLKLKLRNRVENCTLKYRHLSICDL